MPSNNWESKLDRHRNYLRLLARLNFPDKLRSKLDESDVVQTTLLQAVGKLDQFQGTTDEELTGWLRTILSRNLMHLLRDFATAKRDVNREKNLPRSVDQSSVRIANWIQCEQSSPSQKIVRSERLIELADALEQLPAEQREAVELHYFQEKKIEEIGQFLKKSDSAIGGLLFRGLKNLRAKMPANPA